MTVWILRLLVRSFHRTSLAPGFTKPKHLCRIEDIISNTKEVLGPGLEPGSPAFSAVALPTELPHHNSGMCKITATQQPYDTKPHHTDRKEVFDWYQRMNKIEGMNVILNLIGDVFASICKRNCEMHSVYIFRRTNIFCPTLVKHDFYIVVRYNLKLIVGCQFWGPRCDSP